MLNPSQYFLWLLGLDFSTVRVLFKSKIPCFAKYSKLPDLGNINGSSKSLYISLKIFLREGGIFISSFTEKHNPFACDSP